MKKNILLLILFLFYQLAFSQLKFNHILITNDYGIQDADRLLSLAKSVSQVADRVSIIAPVFDRSGTSNRTVYGKHQSTLEITCEYYDKGNNIAVYTLPGNPADCILLGLGGFFGENRPDLVLSGINGGSNIGPDWFGSGTIGAVRMSAFMGVKAIAFSGFDDDNEKSFILIPKWIANFISSGFVDEFDKHSYLTVSFPLIPLEEIKGVKIVKRRITYDKPQEFTFNKIYGEEAHMTDNKTIWVLEVKGNPNNQNITCDDYVLQQGFIIITPMTIDENNEVLMDKLQEKSSLIPEFLK